MRLVVLVGSLLASASIARAQPAAYIEGGAAVGGAGGAAFAAMTLEGGYHPSDGPLWVHTELAAGDTTAIMVPSHGRYGAARIGVEARANQQGLVAVVAGLDAGVRHADLAAGYDYADVPEYNFSHNDAAVFGRLGLDIGNQRVRFRPSIETAVTTRGWDGLALAGGVALQW